MMQTNRRMAKQVQEWSQAVKCVCERERQRDREREERERDAQKRKKQAEKEETKRDGCLVSPRALGRNELQQRGLPFQDFLANSVAVVIRYR